MVARVLWGMVLIVALAFTGTTNAEVTSGRPNNPLGTYEGTLGELPIVIELREGGVARVTLDGDVSEIGWLSAGTNQRGEKLVKIPLTSIKLLYALTPTGLEMRAPARPNQVVTGRDGRPLSVLRRKVGREGADTHPVVSKGIKDTGEIRKPSVEIPQIYPWNRYDPFMDDSSVFSGDASDLPPCPKGTRWTTEELRAKGNLILALSCVGQTGRNGPMLMVLKNGTKLVQSVFRDGRREGRFIQRSPKGGKLLDGWYANDKKIGVWLIWNEKDGSFSHQELWREGVKTAATKTEGGLLELNVDDILSGFSCPEGSKTEEKTTGTTTFRYCIERKGVEHGPAIGWEKTGQVVFRSNFEHGKQHGDTAFWYSSGQLMLRASFNQDYPESHGRRWHDNGVVSVEMTFANGQPEGQYHEYNASGGVITEGKYVEGKKEGLWRAVGRYGLLTQVWERGNLKSGKVQGIFGSIPTKSKSPTLVYQGLEILAPVFGLAEEWVKAEVLVGKVKRARRQLNRTAHTADRERICNEFDTMRMKMDAFSGYSGQAKQLYSDVVDAFCAMKFAPDRNPMFPDSPVKVACKLSNITGRLEESGECIEVSPESCAKRLSTVCKGCRVNMQTNKYECSGRSKSKKRSKKRPGKK